MIKGIIRIERSKKIEGIEMIERIERTSKIRVLKKFISKDLRG